MFTTRKKNLIYVGIALFVVGIAAVLSGSFTQSARATSHLPLQQQQNQLTQQLSPGETGGSGWAWSDTIGWISFSGSTYNVSVVNSSGDLSGYAWSSNIGWISFNENDVASCPSGVGANIDASTGEVSGWIRALSGDEPDALRSGDWDGCIQLSGTNHSSPDLSGNGGVTYDKINRKLVGFAWGSDVVGWIDLVDVSISVPLGSSLNLVANPLTLPSSGGTSLLTWMSRDIQVGSCTASSTDGSWTGSRSEIDLVGESVSLSQTTTYTLTCTGDDGLAISDSVEVRVADVMIPATLFLIANPSTALLPAPFVTNLFWWSPDPSALGTCQRGGGGIGWIGSIDTSTMGTNLFNASPQSNVSVPFPQTSFSINCTNLQFPATVTVTQQAPARPSVTLVSDTTSLPIGGGTANLTWLPNNVNSCSTSSVPSHVAWNSVVPSPQIGTASIGVTQPTNFTIECTNNAGQTVGDTVGISVGGIEPSGAGIPIFEEF
ncbi:hypothetical protein COB64_01390 [Candidatus Wolfebacteria bacterium]|nr:MAG: hypothetical protein COB64_01390 [Candidatus Wolfebacteria bacterium]